MKMDQMKTSTFRKKDLVGPIIIVILLSISVGLMIFYIANPFFNDELEGPYVKELELTKENVRILYDYVSYAPGGERNDVFLTNDTVNKDNIPNKDKLYYALQFAKPDDFKSTGKKDKDKNPIFNISDAKIDTYMKRFFGSSITYKKENSLDCILEFNDEAIYGATLTYSVENKGYDTVLKKDYKKEENEEKKDVKDYVKPFYTKLYKASLFENDAIELQEKIVYTKVKEQNDLYTIEVYGDFRYQNLIEKRNNLTESQLKNSVFNLNEYQDTAATVYYTFKVEEGIYYFDNSLVANNK